MKDLAGNLKTGKSLLQSVTATTTGAIVDTIGYLSKMLLFLTNGSLNCTGGNTWTLTIEDGDTLAADGSLSDAAAVDDSLLVGSLAAAADAAVGTLTFTGGVSDGQTITIGTRVYEFDTNGAVTAGNVAVDVSAGAGAAAAIIALAAAINADASAVVTAYDGAGDTLVATAITAGTAGNSLASTSTAGNAAWGAGTLASGVAAVTVAAGSTGAFAITAALPAGGLKGEIQYLGNKRYLRAKLTKSASAPNIVVNAAILLSGARTLPVD
jgi:hypothetical protein